MIIFLRPTQLHIPDGFLSITVSIVFWFVTVVLLRMAVLRTQGEQVERQIPLMGVMAAFIFAAQMINFPVAGGTSGHMLGGALAAITLGPWAGMLVMASVIGVQAILFQDGGLLALGANIFNMGLITVAIGYGMYQTTKGFKPSVRFAVAGIAAWLSVLAGAFFTSLQLWLSGTSVLRIVIPTMLGVHALIGVGEGLITMAALAFIYRTRPDVLAETEPAQPARGWTVAGFILSLFVVLGSPFASTNPDGLEQVAIRLGFNETARSFGYQVLPDYTLPVLGNTAFSTVLAGGIGLLIVSIIVWGIIFLTRRKTA